MSILRVKVDEFTLRGIGLPDLYTHEWSEEHPPWAYESETQFRETWPEDVVVVPLSSTGATFYERLSNTMVVGQRVVVQLEEGVYHLNAFIPAGSSGDPSYAFGFWFGTMLQGFVGRGPDKTFMQMDAGSMTAEQIEIIGLIDAADFSPIQIGFGRLDSVAGSPCIVAGITFRAEDQPNLLHAQPDTGVITPQPAPHNGLIMYGSQTVQNASLVSYCRFQAAGRASRAAPPYETGNLSSGRSTSLWNNCEFDGRTSPELDPARPRRTGMVMVNGEVSHTIRDSWMHHCNVSRYAANDRNITTSGEYIINNVQIDHVSDNENIDPALNDGKPLGGHSNAACFGFEATNSAITITNAVIRVDNPLPRAHVGNIPMHISLAAEGGRNPTGGILTITDCVGLWSVHPHLNGFIGIRPYKNTGWYSSGVENTIFVIRQGQRLLPFEYNDIWPPTQDFLDSNNVSYKTHYLLRSV